MAARREITKKLAREYAKADKAGKGEVLDTLVATTGWTRDHARRAIRHASRRVGPARAQPRRPRPRKYSYDALVVLQEVWRLAGQPSGKYLAAVMDDTLERLLRFNELGKVQPRATPEALAEVRAMSAATIDRYSSHTRMPSTRTRRRRPSQHLRRQAAPERGLGEPVFSELDLERFGGRGRAEWSAD